MSDTVKRWTWIIVLVVAVIMHVIFLPDVPLSPGEVSQALTSLDSFRLSDSSPQSKSTLLLLGNTLLFGLFGAGNGIARLLPSLVGIALVLLPLFWRSRLGEVGVLTAASVLLISPLLLFTSRRVEGTVLSVFAVGLMFTALLSFWDNRKTEKRRDILITLGVCLGLLSGPAFYDMLLTGITAWFFWQWSRRVKIDWDRYRVLGHPGLVGMAIAVLISIGLGFRWNGWNGIMDGFSQWLASWTMRSDISHIGALLLYEPLTLVLAILGLGHALKRRASLPLALAFWALLILLIVSMRGGATITGLAEVIFPLAYLAGYGMKNLTKMLTKHNPKWVILHIGMCFICLIPGFLGLTQYGSGLVSAEQPVLVLSGVFVLLALQALLAFLFSLVLPADVLWRSTVLGISVMCLYIQTGFSFQLSYVRPTSALEPAVMAAGSPDMKLFKQMITDIAVRRGLREDTLAITVVDLDSEVTNSVLWTLQNFAKLKVSATWPSETEKVDTDTVVITPESMDLSAVTTSGVYKGMRFTVFERYLAPSPGCRRTTTIDCTDLANWYLYRTSPYPLSRTGLILWAKD